MRPHKTLVCRWCCKALGVLDGWLLLCPRCDHAGAAGPPREDDVRDQPPRP